MTHLRIDLCQNLTVQSSYQGDCQIREFREIKEKSGKNQGSWLEKYRGIRLMLETLGEISVKVFAFVSTITRFLKKALKKPHCAP